MKKRTRRVPRRRRRSRRRLPVEFYTRHRSLRFEIKFLSDG